MLESEQTTCQVTVLEYHEQTYNNILKKKQARKEQITNQLLLFSFLKYFNKKIYKNRLGLSFNTISFNLKDFGSGALSGLMLDLGLLKISLGGVFSYF